METPERDWTDSRLDDLKKAVDAGNEEMRAGFSELRGEMKAGFAKVDSKLTQLMLGLLGGAVVIIAALIGLIAALIAS